MIPLIKKILFFIVIFWSLNLTAQSKKIPISAGDYQNTTVEMADQFREDGKIYVVIAVFSVILGGLIAYLVVIDRKTKKLEQIHDKHVR